jgi:GntR family transcriptional regulator, transcriptional repressor for pyruvate dehydrogenase complex
MARNATPLARARPRPIRPSAGAPVLASRTRPLGGLEGKLSGGIYEHIFERIVAGEFPVNARLPSETELALRLGASRPVVREALARLREDGVIVSRQGSGSYVRRRPDVAVLRFVPVSSIADVQRGFEFRVGLEGAAAALAAERWEAADIAEIRRALEALDRCIANGELGVDADVQFHRAIAQATHNPYHVAVQATLQAQIAFGMNLTRNLSLRDGSRLRLVQDEHVAIVAAVEARDGRCARAEMERHIENARRRMFEGHPPTNPVTKSPGAQSRRRRPAP